MVGNARDKGHYRPDVAGRWVTLRLIWNESTWICFGLFALIALTILTSQGVRPESEVVFLVELAFPPLIAALVVPLALLDRDFRMAEILNATATPASVRIGRRVCEVLALPLILVAPLAGVLYKIAGVPGASWAVFPPIMVAMSSIALTIFMAGLAFAVATVTGSQVAGYTMPPAVVIGVITLKRFVPTVIQPFPVASAFRCELAAFAFGPITDMRVFWLNRIGYAAAGAILIALTLFMLDRSHWSY